MVSVYYPALLPFGKLKPYVTPEESRLMLAAIGETSVPADIFSTVRTHARIDVPPLPRWHGFPLVVLSPGLSLPRTSLTALAEDLASRGYMVAAVDHTYEAVAITFPDGRITECLICENRPPGPVATRSRAADITFVLDELTGRHSPWRWSWILDPDRIAMAGHSLGGASTMTTMLRDERVRAGVNLDGPFLPQLETEMNRPFMMFGAENSQPGDDETWDVTWEHLTGWRRWLTVDGTGHNSVTDYGLLFDQLGLGTPHQSLPGQRTVQITREYAAAFMDLHLRHRPQRLLDGPSSRYPEVRFQP